MFARILRSGLAIGIVAMAACGGPDDGAQPAVGTLTEPLASSLDTEPPVSTTEATTTSVTVAAPTTTTTDPSTEDALLIRRLVYEQEQFMLTLRAQTDWSANDYVRFSTYMHERSEPAYRNAMQRRCTNHAELDREEFLTIPDSDKPYWFTSWSLDVGTLQPDANWTTNIDGDVIFPEGRTYIGTIELQNFAGETSTGDVQFNVQNGEAYWFVGRFEFDGCIRA